MIVKITSASNVILNLFQDLTASLYYPLTADRC